MSDKIKQTIKTVELKEQFKDVEPLKQKLEDLKQKNKEEFKIDTKEIPTIRVIQIPMRNIKLDDLDTLSIDYLRDLHFEIFGTKAPRDRGFGRKWIANKIKTSFKIK